MAWIAAFLTAGQAEPHLDGGATEWAFTAVIAASLLSVLLVPCRNKRLWAPIKARAAKGKPAGRVRPDPDKKTRPTGPFFVCLQYLCP